MPLLVSLFSTAKSEEVDFWVENHDAQKSWEERLQDGDNLEKAALKALKNENQEVTIIRAERCVVLATCGIVDGNPTLILISASQDSPTDRLRKLQVYVRAGTEKREARVSQEFFRKGMLSLKIGSRGEVKTVFRGQEITGKQTRIRYASLFPTLVKLGTEGGEVPSAVRITCEVPTGEGVFRSIDFQFSISKSLPVVSSLVNSAK